MKLYMMSGIPNSGKSTQAAAIAAETGATLIAHDAYYSRLITPETNVTSDILRQVFELALADVKAHLEAGEDVVFDSTNTTRKDRADVLEACNVDGCEYICVYMDTPLEQCEARGAEWCRVFHRSLEEPTEDEGFDEIIISTDGRNAE